MNGRAGEYGMAEADIAGKVYAMPSPGYLEDVRALIGIVTVGRALPTAMVT